MQDFGNFVVLAQLKRQWLSCDSKDLFDFRFGDAVLDDTTSNKASGTSNDDLHVCSKEMNGSRENDDECRLR